MIDQLPARHKPLLALLTGLKPKVDSKHTQIVLSVLKSCPHIMFQLAFLFSRLLSFLGTLLQLDTNSN